MTNSHTPSSCLTRALRRAFLGAGSLALCTLLPAQKFQYDYGTLPPTLNRVEIGTCLVKMPIGNLTNYLVAGPQGNDVAGVLTNPNGGTIASGRHVPMMQGLTLTPECARRTADGGLIVSGEVQGGPASGQEVFLAYYTAGGALWPLGLFPNKYALYSGERTGIRQGTRVVEMAPNPVSTDRFAVITNTDLAGGGSRGVLFTTAANGALGCWYSFGASGYQVRFHDLCQDTDGTFLIVGSLRSNASPLRVTLVLRTDSCGTILWRSIYATTTGGEDVEQHAITKTAGGRFAVWGHFSPTSVSPGSFLFEIFGTGGVVWRTHFPTIAGSRPTIACRPNGELLMNGRFGDDGLVLRTNSAGLAPVARTYGILAPSIEEIFQVDWTADGGYVAAGSSQISDPTLSNFYLVKTDANGDSNCNWQPLVVPQTFPPPIVSTRALQSIPGGQVSPLDMLPLVDATEEHKHCLTPASCVWIGNTTGTTVGLPSLAPGSPANIGNLGFQIHANGLVPNGVTFVALSLGLATPALPLAMFGGQPGSMLYLDPGMLTTFPVMVNAIGEASVSFPIPGNPALVGLPLHWQAFDFDPALPFPLPLGNSQAMSVVIQ